MKKFRAWHKTAKQMLNSRDQGYEGEVFKWLKEGQPIEIMQFTGIHDKTGKEIYEGDIVKYSFGKHFWISEIKAVGGQFGINLFAVEIRNNLCRDMENGQYNYEISTANSGSRNAMQGGKDIEILGNIYENPELVTP